MARDLCFLGRALASPARAVFLSLLMDGSSRPATELAAHAGVGRSTASEHLSALLDAGLLTVEPRGRQRFYRLTSAEVAAGLEHLGQLCPPLPAPRHRPSREARDLAAARLCYDHLAGELGVAVLDGLLRQEWLDDDLSVTNLGSRGLRALLDVDVLSLRGGRRVVARRCPDWTQRRPHLAGALGAAVAASCLSRRWVQRRRSGRGLVVTPAGRAGLELLVPREALAADGATATRRD
ncbi:MAG: winged helix-turn-helix domain-containing protein [Frankia sp.]|nr:winged helix-turn-helix domain-containing protein [Frankia sp.]